MRVRPLAISPNVKALEEYMKDQFEKSNTVVGGRLAALVQQAYEEGKIPVEELSYLVSTIRHVGHTNNGICDQLYHIWEQHKTSQ
jgi:hypothetical protein